MVTSRGSSSSDNPGNSSASTVRIRTAEKTRVPGQWSSDQGKSVLRSSLNAQIERETGSNSCTTLVGQAATQSIDADASG